MRLVDSIKQAKASVGDAFDQLVSDVEADEASEASMGDGTGSALVKVVAYYEDGSTVELAPPSTDTAEVKDLTKEAPVEGEEKSDPTTPPAAGGQEIPAGNAEQV